MRARRDTTALNSLLRESSFPQDKEWNVVFKEKGGKHGKCNLLYMICGAVRRSFFMVSFCFGKKKLEAIDKRDRSPFELNMGSKRSAVILISYIYKNVKREGEKERKKKKDDPLNVVFVRWYVV